MLHLVTTNMDLLPVCALYFGVRRPLAKMERGSMRIRSLSNMSEIPSVPSVTVGVGNMLVPKKIRNSQKKKNPFNMKNLKKIIKKIKNKTKKTMNKAKNIVLLRSPNAPGVRRSTVTLFFLSLYLLLCLIASLYLVYTSNASPFIASILIPSILLVSIIFAIFLFILITSRRIIKKDSNVTIFLPSQSLDSNLNARSGPPLSSPSSSSSVLKNSSNVLQPSSRLLHFQTNLLFWKRCYSPPIQK